MLIALIHWRIKPDQDSIDAFLTYWQTRNTIDDRSGLMGEFLSDSLSMKDHPYITWHLDSESLGDFKSYVTVGIWGDAAAFKSLIEPYFNDERPMLPFEMYRRRRVVFNPVHWRIGEAHLPIDDSEGVQ